MLFRILAKFHFKLYINFVKTYALPVRHVSKIVHRAKRNRHLSVNGQQTRTCNRPNDVFVERFFYGQPSVKLMDTCNSGLIPLYDRTLDPPCCVRVSGGQENMTSSNVPGNWVSLLIRFDDAGFLRINVTLGD